MTCSYTKDPCNPEIVTTPCDVSNIQGLSALRYRIGSHGHFKEALLRKLSEFPELQSMTTRSDDDPAIALLDAWSAALDVLTFYQERIINEGYLPTATERRSILELAKLIGYKLSPGVAASTYLSFTLEPTPTGDDSVVLHKGMQVHSVPEQDENSQTFETTEEVVGRVAWNELIPQQSLPQSFDRTTDTIYVQGTSLTLEKGDLILLVGSRRETSPFSERWDVRRVLSVEPLFNENITRISWITDLGHVNPIVDPAEQPRLFTLRKKASLFGYNAADWRGLPEATKQAYDPASNAEQETPQRADEPEGNARTEWPDFEIKTIDERQIDLDREYNGILPDDWVLLDKPGYRELYRVVKSYTSSRKDYGLTGKVTSLELDYQQHLSWFPLRKSTVYISDTELPIAERPLTTPVFGDTILLSESIPHFDVGRILILRGTPVTMLRVAYPMESDSTRDPESDFASKTVVLTSLDNSTATSLAIGEIVTLLKPPVVLDNGKTRWTVQTADGDTGTIDTEYDELEVVEDESSEDTGIPTTYNSDDTVETIRIKSMFSGTKYTTLVLESPLRYAYIRSTIKIYGNTVAATHGESRSEPLGSGDNSAAHQQFKLRQFPLTYIPAITPSGTESTLEIRVDGIAWKEVPSLYDANPDDRVYTVHHNDDGTAVVQFGDGISGERLPTGRDNVTASYRIGIGLEGQVHRGQINLAMSRPLGFKDVINHIPSSDAQDSESLEDGRNNAPKTIITLDRIVSVRDYENFARSYAGIGKARSIVLWSGETNIIHLTVGTSDGKPVASESDLMVRLAQSIDSSRHGDHQLIIDTYKEEKFGCSFQIKIDETYNSESVLNNVKTILMNTYSFRNRDFAQGTTASELLALVHEVEGVAAAILTELNGNDPLIRPDITAQNAHWDTNKECIIPATLLTIDDEHIVLEEMNS